MNTPPDIPEQRRRVLLSVGTPPEATRRSRSGRLGQVGIVAGAIIGGGALLSTVATWTVVSSVGDTPDQTLWVKPPRVERVSPSGSASERAERGADAELAETRLRSTSSPSPSDSASEDGDSSGHGSGGDEEGDSSGHGSGDDDDDDDDDDDSSGHGSGHD